MKNQKQYCFYWFAVLKDTADYRKFKYEFVK